MPHQCLGCGFAFAEGSSDLLNGCPECKGTRFFYAAAPVEDAEREAIQAKAQKDIRQVVTDLLQEAAPEAAKEMLGKADSDGWATLKPKDIRRLVKQVKASAPEPELNNEPVNSPKRLKAAEAARAQILADLDDVESKPDTVTIESPGEYAIDIKGLLEKNPIVVHKDGAYLIHLPSLFDK